MNYQINLEEELKKVETIERIMAPIHEEIIVRMSRNDMNIERLKSFYKRVLEILHALIKINETIKNANYPVILHALSKPINELNKYKEEIEHIIRKDKKETIAQLNNTYTEFKSANAFLKQEIGAVATLQNQVQRQAA